VGASESAIPVFDSVIGAVRPFDSTARASVQISATYRADPILPLSLYLKVYLNVNKMSEYEFLSVSCCNLFTAVVCPGFVPSHVMFFDQGKAVDRNSGRVSV